MLRGIQSKDIDLVWPQVLPHLKRVLAESTGDYSEEGIRQELKGKDSQLWVWVVDNRITAVLITSLCAYPNRTVCLLKHLAGEKMADWFDHLPVLEAWARYKGCEEFEIYGRRGWGRALGWREVYTHYRRKL